MARRIHVGGERVDDAHDAAVGDRHIAAELLHPEGEDKQEQQGDYPG